MVFSNIQSIRDREEYIKSTWADVSNELSEYLGLKKISPINIKLQVENNSAANMKSNAKEPYIIICYTGITYSIGDILNEISIKDNDEDKCASELLKIIFWHEIFHILLGHKLSIDDKKRIKEENEELIQKQLEFIADGMAIRTYMPFIITKRDISKTNEEEMAKFLTLLYAYYLKQDKLEKDIGKPMDHPKANVRFELLLKSTFVFINEWNKLVPDDKIDESLIYEKCNDYFELSGIKDYISELDLDDENEIKAIMDISCKHWIWKKCIEPYDEEYSFLG